MSTTTTKPRGRQFFANPGPTNIPDSVLRAMDRPSIDFNDPEFVEVYDAAFAGVKRVLRTQQHLFMYNASGHGAWEASLTNLLSPGDTILVLESGYFSDEWGDMAHGHGLNVRTLPADWRMGVDLAAFRPRSPPTPRGEIKAVCAVHNETATGMMLPLDEIRAVDRCRRASRRCSWSTRSPRSDRSTSAWTNGRSIASSAAARKA